MTWNIINHITYLQKLLVPGVIGNYNSFEVTEILGFHQDSPKRATNFLSLLVAEPSFPLEGQCANPTWLNGKRIELHGTPWKFGIARYRISIQKVQNTLENFSTTGEWKPGTSALKIGFLTPLPPQFVPADTTMPHPWNGILKNNFWDGSHILELFDTQKPDVKFLLDEPKLLKQLAEDIITTQRIGIDGLSDRLGNVLIQLPVTVVTTKLSSSSNGDFLVHPFWRHGTSPRPLRVSCEKYEDTTVEGYCSEDVTDSQATFSIYSPGGGARYALWDDQHQLLLGASAKTAFITSIGMNVNIVAEGVNTREFFLPSSDGTLAPVAVPLIEKQEPNIIGNLTSNPREPWRENRVFRDNLKGIRERREFIQYGGNSGAGTNEALKDIHALLQIHGKTGAWLWDPYLDARDILSTLFYCPHKGADLRALTTGEVPPIAKEKGTHSEAALGFKSAEMPPPKQPWRDKQLATFKNSMGNCKDLRLEFRIREGNAGWSFHDRFLIFPSETGPATAWSLGTSVNSFGQNHHILQKVADGELIRQAFLDLWHELNGSAYLVWSTT